MKNRINRLRAINKDNMEAIHIIEAIESKISRAMQIMETCKTQVGMITGEEIEGFLAEMKNQRFCSKEYNYERLPGEQ